MPRVYLDTSPVIFLVEQVHPHLPRVLARLSPANVVRVASELTRMECLIVPLRVGDTALVQEFERFFSSRVAEMVPFPSAVFRRAAEIRARHGFKTPDALHLAAAVESGCDVLLTNDAQLTRFTGITVEVV